MSRKSFAWRFSPASFFRPRSTAWSRTAISLLAAMGCMCGAGALSNAQEQAVALRKPRVLEPDALEAGWISLFDGETMFGWSPVPVTKRADQSAAAVPGPDEAGGDFDQDDSGWEVEDGAIQARGGEPRFLRLTTGFRDFELSLEFESPPETNSGVFVRSSAIPTNPAEDCLEVNIAPAENPFPTGSIVGRVKGAVPAFRGGWRQLTLRAEGNDVTTSVDGQLVTSYREAPASNRDSILLQFNTGPIRFREIRLRPLGLLPFFTGQDLNGWNTAGIGASSFEVEPEGQLHVTSGPGQLETAESYGDFVMQFECRTESPGLNSGMFFRCIPGDKLMGYESQISHALIEGDRTRPADAGTGAIFRRQAARYVPGNDLEWCAVTVVARGNHFSTWVQGLQVVDWTDTRAADPNPRKGARIEPGTIMIQGHDPTTNVRFRNLRIGE